MGERKHNDPNTVMGSHHEMLSTLLGRQVNLVVKISSFFFSFHVKWIKMCDKLEMYAVKKLLETQWCTVTGMGSLGSLLS